MMGTHIYFRHCRSESLVGSMLFDESEFAESLGTANFSAFTMERQKKTYGIDYADCLTYDEPGSPEMIGPPGVADYHGWYTPDWSRALVRVERLYVAVMADQTGRREYDEPKVGKLRELIRLCALHPDRNNCQVNFSD